VFENAIKNFREKVPLSLLIRYMKCILDKFSAVYYISAVTEVNYATLHFCNISQIG